MSLFDPASMTDAELVERLGEKLIWELPPEWVELPSDLDPSHSVPQDWAAIVRCSFTEAVDGSGDRVAQRWGLSVGHDEDGARVGAELVRGPVEITHDGWSGTCALTEEGDELIDNELDGEHTHRRWSQAAVVRESFPVDPLALIRAIADARGAAGIDDDDDPDLVPEERWRRAVVDLMERKRRTVPKDLLPLLADGTITAGWGSQAEWPLNAPRVLVPSKVSVHCRPAPDSKPADYEVMMRLRGLLEESGLEACGIADDLESMLQAYYCRTFAVDVIDSVTGIRGRSGDLP